MAPLRLLVAVTLLIACDRAQSGAATIPPEAGVGTRAAIAVAAPAGLLGLDASGRVLGHIVRLPEGLIPSAPTLHPGGTTIVFVLSNPARDGGSDIYTVDLDGNNLRALVTHEKAGVFYASPALAPDGAVLYVHRRAVDLDRSQPAASRTDDRIERVDLRSGERRTVLTDAAEPALSPDGRTLVFVHLVRGEQDALWTSSAEGGAAGPFFKTGDRFVFLQAPRIAPNARELVISTAGHLVARAGGLEPTPAGGRSAHLDIQSEIFIAPLDGTGLRSIGRTVDDVVPAWSRDGARVAFIAAGTLSIVSAADGAVQRATAVPIRYGDPLWLR